MKKYPSFKHLRPSNQHASQVGQGNGSRDTSPERILRSHLRRVGMKPASDAPTLLGKPDFVFARDRVAVFCDGDFWHGGNWSLRRRRLLYGANAGYWIAKIERNMDRDREVSRRLSKMGWRVLRFWESKFVWILTQLLPQFLPWSRNAK